MTMSMDQEKRKGVKFLQIFNSFSHSIAQCLIGVQKKHTADRIADELVDNLEHPADIQVSVYAASIPGAFSMALSAYNILFVSAFDSENQGMVIAIANNDEGSIEAFLLKINDNTLTTFFLTATFDHQGSSTSSVSCSFLWLPLFVLQ